MSVLCSTFWMRHLWCTRGSAGGRWGCLRLWELRIARRRTLLRACLCFLGLSSVGVHLRMEKLGQLETVYLFEELPNLPQSGGIVYVPTSHVWGVQFLDLLVTLVHLVLAFLS